MDYCFVILKITEIQKFQQVHKLIKNNIQFTFEKDENGKLPVLDVLLSVQTVGTLTRGVYSENHPLPIAISTTTVTNSRGMSSALLELFKRKHSPNAQIKIRIFFEPSKVRLDLSNNVYPYKLINKCEKNIAKPCFVGENSEETKQNPAAHISDV